MLSGKLFIMAVILVLNVYVNMHFYFGFDKSKVDWNECHEMPKHFVSKGKFCLNSLQ